LDAEYVKCIKEILISKESKVCQNFDEGKPEFCSLFFTMNNNSNANFYTMTYSYFSKFNFKDHELCGNINLS